MKSPKHLLCFLLFVFIFIPFYDARSSFSLGLLLVSMTVTQINDWGHIFSGLLSPLPSPRFLRLVS